jgi:hypothetical protein
LILKQCIIMLIQTEGKDQFLRPFLFLVYITNPPATVTNISKPILFVDDTSILITNRNPSDFINNSREVFRLLFEWFNSTQLSVISIKLVSSNLSQEMPPVLTFRWA